MEEFDIAYLFFQLEGCCSSCNHTTSFNHARLRGASASTELLQKVTDTLNHYLFYGAILTGSHQAEDLLKMDSITDFSRYPKTSCLSGKEPHHRRLYSKA